MITNFKIYEKYNFESWYKIGDYVLLKGSKWRVDLEVYIYDLFYDEDENRFKYHVEGVFRNNNEKTVFWVEDSEIERKMTPEEIENYKIKQSANKYNL